MTSAVVVDPRVRRAWPTLRGLAVAPVGAVVIGFLGEVLVLREDGGADQVLPGGYPRQGIAADPCPGRRAA